jgi:isocitrate dehydrogenase (NAD+)
MTHQVTLIPGDWIGPETCRVAQAVIDAAGVRIDWRLAPIENGAVTEAVLAACRETKTVLKAKVASTPNPGELPPTVRLRKALGLWATVRPVTALPNTRARFPNTDLIIVRETSEDIYSGLEHTVTTDVFEAVKITTRAACERIAHFAYQTAQAASRKKVTIVHKSNIMKRSDGMFLRIAQTVGTEYPDIETDEVIVDALCMRLVKDPSWFDVLLTGNLFGDIVSDLCAGLAGGITAAPSASYGEGIALFENPHGSAPDLVGTGRANPIPMLRTAALMLTHLGEDTAAKRIEAAVHAACAGGLHTVDNGGDDGCAAVQSAVLAALK